MEKYLSGPWRIEAEFAYRMNEANGVIFNDVVQADVSGDVSTFSGMLNFFADWDTHTRFRPYVGGGIGVAFVDVNNQCGGLPAKLNDDDSTFACQFMTGLTMSINDCIDFFLSIDFWC